MTKEPGHLQIPRAIVMVNELHANIPAGTSNRILSSDAQGTAMPANGELRRYIDLGRLTKGRSPDGIVCWGSPLGLYAIPILGP